MQKTIKSSENIIAPKKTRYKLLSLKYHRLLEYSYGISIKKTLINEMFQTQF